MSASPIARQISESKVIPARSILINDASELPGSYSTTPGGTLFSTTPGGTRIVYERSFLMNLRNSPVSKTPPQWELPAGILRASPKQPPKKHNPSPLSNGRPHPDDSFEQFQMDM